MTAGHDGGRELKSQILSPSRGVKKTCRWHVFSPDLGGYAAVADSPLSEGAKYRCQRLDFVFHPPLCECTTGESMLWRI